MDFFEQNNNYTEYNNNVEVLQDDIVQDNYEVEDQGPEFQIQKQKQFVQLQKPKEIKRPSSIESPINVQNKKQVIKMPTSDDEKTTLLKKPSKLNYITFKELNNLKAPFFFSSMHEAVLDYKQLTKNQLIDKFYLQGEHLYDLVERESVKYFKQAQKLIFNNTMQLRSYIIENAEESLINDFVQYIRGLKEFELCNGLVFKCFMNLWFQGLIIKNFKLNINKIKQINILTILLCQFVSIKVIYEPDKKFNQSYFVLSLPLFQVNEKGKHVKCASELVLRAIE